MFNNPARNSFGKLFPQMKKVLWHLTMNNDQLTEAMQ
jgi:hypothetical protein